MAVTQMVLKSAIVMIDCVGSLMIVPGVTAKAVMLPPTGAVTVSKRDAGLASGGTPSIFKRAWVLRYSASACAAVALRLIQILFRGRTDLGLLLLPRQQFLRQLEGIGGLVVVVIGLRQIRRIDDRERLARARRALPTPTFSSTTRPPSAGSTAAVRAGSDSTSAGSNSLGLTGCSAPAPRSGGYAMRSPRGPRS